MKKASRTKTTRAKATPKAARAKATPKAARAKATPKAAPSPARRASRGEPTAARQARALELLSGLKALYPVADCALHHHDAFQLLVATILSAQSTDATVNRVTPELFVAYPDARALALADEGELQALIHRTGFFRQKAKSLLGAARRLVDAYGGEVPDRLEDLVTLPGVARKTANVVLGTWFGKNEGVVVDTHVGRLAHRMGLTWSSRDEKDAVKIEQDLQRLIPREEWTWFSHAMIWHGRKVCSARKPACEACPLAPACPAAFST